MTTESDSGLQEMRGTLRRLEERLAEMERRLEFVEKAGTAGAPTGVPAARAAPVSPEVYDFAARGPAASAAPPAVHAPSAPPPPVPAKTTPPSPPAVHPQHAAAPAVPPPPPPPVPWVPARSGSAVPPAPPVPQVPAPAAATAPSAGQTSIEPLVRAAEHKAAAPSRAAAFAARNMTAAPAGKPRDARTLESKIGKSWTSWVGGLILLGGVLFFLQYAWAQGWIHPTPAGRIVASLSLGAVFIALGQWVYRKKMGPLAASLTATGLAVLMAAFFAANTAFDPPVLSRGAAFLGVAIVGAVGIALALQMRMMSLGILALVGMYISPAILSSGDDKSLEFLAYLAVVTAVGLGVSFFKRKWLAVRGVAFVGGWLWLMMWVTAGQAPAHGVLAVAACSVFFAMFLAEMVGSLMRFMSPPADDAPSPADRPASPNTVVLETAASLLSFANTTLAMTAFAVAFHRGGMEGLWIVALGLCGAMGVVSFATASKYFSIAAGIQSMALLALAVPLYFVRSAITVAWGILGLALAVYAYFTDSKAARGWMIVMLGLVSVRLCTFDFFDPRLHRALLTIASESITHWMLMGWGAGVYGLLIAWLGRVRETVAEDGKITKHGVQWVAVVGSAVGTFLWCVATLAGFHTGMPVMVFLIGWATGLMFLGPRVVNAAVAMSVEAAGTILVLVVAVPFYFEHAAVVGAWVFLGMAPALYAYFTNNRYAWLWTFGMSVLVAARVLMIDYGDATLQAPLRTIAGVQLTAWMLLGWGVSLYVMLLAWLSRERPTRTAEGLEPWGVRWMMSADVAIGTLVCCFVAGVGLDPVSPVTFAVILWALLVIGFGFITVPPPLAKWVETPAVVLLFAGGAKWLAFDGLQRSVFDPGEHPESVLPFVNLFVLNGLLMVAAILLARMLREAGKAALGWWIAGIGFVILNVECLRGADRWLVAWIAQAGHTAADPWLVKNVVISILWGLVSFGAILIGFSKKIAQVRWVALVLLGLTVLKVLIIDMANVETILRVLSFMVVGAVLLLVSYVYHKVGRKQQQETGART